MKYYNAGQGKGVLIKSWCGNPEAGALEQTLNLARLPFAFHHIALMPDVHLGYGMPIGAVMAAKNVVVPNAVGLDIGCGMCATRIGVEEISPENLKTIMGKIRDAVPIGFAHHQKPKWADLLPRETASGLPVIEEQYESAICQLGTLGGGNHFIDILRGSDGFVWVMLHSGSRNLGKQVADYYNKVAAAGNELWHSRVPKDYQLAFLPLSLEDARTYIGEMEFCVRFAHANRQAILSDVLAAIAEVTSAKSVGDTINVSHNYARMENHFGQNVMVHRKGAISARAGEIGIIPGSGGTPSYIVEGKGNPDSFMSCSHGAGRNMGRNEAKRTLDFETEVKRLEDQGIVHSLRNPECLDEAPGAYKDINVVMEESAELVEIKVKLMPLAVINAPEKGRRKK